MMAIIGRTSSMCGRPINTFGVQRILQVLPAHATEIWTWVMRAGNPFAKQREDSSKQRDVFCKYRNRISIMRTQWYNQLLTEYLLE
jgi:hypothetical protein